MALVVETGSVVPGANSYVDLEYADSYFSGHVFSADAWDDLQDDAKENLLISATYQLETMYEWYGFRVQPGTQNLGWPRSAVPVRDGGYVIGYLPQDAIPDQLKRATCEMALMLSKGDPFAEDDSANLNSIKIDVIELNFKGSAARKPLPPAVPVLLLTLGRYLFGGRVRKVIVG